MIKQKHIHLLYIVIFISCMLISVGSVASNYKTVNVFTTLNNPKIDFAMSELNAVLFQIGISMHITDIENANIAIVTVPVRNSLDETTLKLEKSNSLLDAEGFTIRIDENGLIWVVGADAAGAMYGTLELSEQIDLFGIDGISETTQNPHMTTRGVKFNIPLDLRTPSYSCPGENSQHNIPVMWEMEFWKEYIDHLARARYNLISLWNLHPFPSMVRVPEYPDVALDDVYRTTAEFAKEFYEIGNGAKTPELLASYEIVIRITIDEKITFWREVMRYAKERNIDFYIMTWNIFDWGIDGKYGITEDLHNPVTRDYFRQSVKQMLLTYPDLAGIGITVGENMRGYKSAAKEEWAFETYGLGVLDVAKAFPNRKITFIHRMHQGDVQDILDQFSPVLKQENIDFLFSFKYTFAHFMSSTTQNYADQFVNDISDKEEKTIWTIRQDSNYFFRWGAPDFVREFIRNVPLDVSQGYYFGSDGFIWGREYLGKEFETPRQLEIEKHWYQWMMWGRMGYDPGLSNERIVGMIHNRFPETVGTRLFEAWQQASMIYPVTTGFHWGRADFSWFIEGCRSHPIASIGSTGFHNVNQFIIQPTHPTTRNQDIPTYVRSFLDNGMSDSITPPQVSQRLHEHADKALNLIEGIDVKDNHELAQTIEDIRSMAFLGKYYAFKINGATYLHLYRETYKKEYQDLSVDQLTLALEYWELYTSSAKLQYINPVRMKRVGDICWEMLTEEVKNDIKIAASGEEFNIGIRRFPR